MVEVPSKLNEHPTEKSIRRRVTRSALWSCTSNGGAGLLTLRMWKDVEALLFLWQTHKKISRAGEKRTRAA